MSDDLAVKVNSSFQVPEVQKVEAKVTEEQARTTEGSSGKPQ